jgi:hypothetical protein
MEVGHVRRSNKVLTFHIWPTIKNLTSAPAFYAYVTYLFDSRVKIDDNGYDMHDMGTMFEVMDGKKCEVRQFRYNWGATTKMPLLLDVDNQAANNAIVVVIHGDGIYPIFWKIQSPKMTQRSGCYELTCDKGVVKLTDLGQ